MTPCLHKKVHRNVKGKLYSWSYKHANVTIRNECFFFNSIWVSYLTNITSNVILTAGSYRNTNDVQILTIALRLYFYGLINIHNPILVYDINDAI